MKSGHKKNRKSHPTIFQGKYRFLPISLFALLLSLYAASGTEIRINHDYPEISLEVTTDSDAWKTIIYQSEDLIAWNELHRITGAEQYERLPVSGDFEKLFFYAEIVESLPPLGNVWCIGDSWTDCWLGNTWRSTVWQTLSEEDWDFDFIGSQRSGILCELGTEFDRAHDGYGGITASEFLERTDTLLETVGSPDSVFLMLGYNDFNLDSEVAVIVERIEIIIELIRTENPNTVFHVGMYGYVREFLSDETLDQFASGLTEMVDLKKTGASPIFFVDHRIGWEKSEHLDFLDHPSPAGMEHLAENWLQSIRANHLKRASEVDQ